MGIGLLSIICVILATVILLLTSIGSTLGIVLIFAYVLILLLSTPLFVLDIANTLVVDGPLKGKINFYLLVLLLALALFLIEQIPFVGGLLSFLFVIISTGRIIRNLIRIK